MLTSPFGIALLPPRVAPPVWQAPDVDCPRLDLAVELLEQVQDQFASFPPGGRADNGLRSMLMQAYEACPSNATIVDEVGEGLKLLGEKAAAHDLYSEAAKQGIFHHPLQRVLKDFNPHLRSAMLLQKDAWEELPELHEIYTVITSLWKELQVEFFRARKNWKSGYEKITQCQGDARQCWRGWRWAEGVWGHYFVAPKSRDTDFSEWRWDGDPARCQMETYPLLCRLLAHFKSRGFEMPMAAITEVRAPKTHIPSHRSQQWRLRFVCPLFVPRNATSRLHFPGVGDRLFLERDCFWFDESYEHEQIYKGNTFRSALLLDLKHPGLDGRPPRGDWASAWWNASAAVNVKETTAVNEVVRMPEIRSRRVPLARHFSEIADETTPDVPFCWQNGRIPKRCCGDQDEAAEWGCWDSSPSLNFQTCCGTHPGVGRNIARRNADVTVKTAERCSDGRSSGGGTLYLPSQLERAFTSDPLEMTSNLTLMCQILDRRVRSSWLRQIRGLEPVSEDIFSRQCSEGQFAYIEPLGGVLRDPRFICEGRQHLVFTDWLLFADKSFLKPQGRKIFVDAGGSRFRDALRFFLAEYASRGIVFDEIVVWEAGPQGLESYWHGVPPEIRAAVEPILKFNDGVKVQAARNSPDNPMRFIEANCAMDDFCVFKLDIDQPSVEGALVQQLIESTRTYGPLVDEFFYEHHVLGVMEHYGWAHTWFLAGEKSSETFADSYELFSGLRESGIRAHSWI